jgi:hypothetical protein
MCSVGNDLYRRGQGLPKSNKTGNVGINVTLRRVRVTTVAMEKQ